MAKKKIKMPAASTYKERLPHVDDKTRFMFIGKGKAVHVINNKATDMKTEANGGSGCMVVRKAHVAGRIKPRNKDKGLSPEATLALNGCGSCRTEVVAKRMLPDTKREDRKAARDEVLDRARPAKKTKPAKQAKVKAASKPKAERKPSQPTKTKAGTRSVGSSSLDKAEDLAVFVRDQGWRAEVFTGEHDSAKVVAKHGDKVVECNFIDGKYDITNQASITVGAWSGTLRGAHAVRRQIDKSLDDRDRPHPVPGKGRGGPRGRKADEVEVAEDESPEDAHRRVPFLLDDDEATVLDAVKGHVIRWRNGVSKSVEEARVPPEVGKGKRPWVSISVHPKSGRRILDFFVFEGMADGDPVFGPERAVALDKIIRVLDA